MIELPSPVPIFFGIYCGAVSANAGDFDAVCPFEKDHPTIPVRSRCAKFGKTLRLGADLTSLRCRECRVAHPLEIK